MELFSVGEMVIDFLPGTEPGSYIRHAGGAPANVAIALVRNGFSAGFCGKLGRDDFGDFLAQTLRENGVKQLCEARTEQAVTTMAFVTLRADGERSFTFARKPGADMLLVPEEVLSEDIDACTIVHAGSCSLSAEPAAGATRRALQLGLQRGKLVSFDVNYRSLMWGGNEGAAAAAIAQVLPCVDLLKVSDEEVALLGGEAALPRLMEENDIALIALTLGPKGARCYHQGRTLDAPCSEVRRVDTTGAGDAFWGAFLSELLRRGCRTSDDLRPEVVLSALQAGNAAGTLSVQRKGAIPSLPTREEIAECLRQGGFS